MKQSTSSQNHVLHLTFSKNINKILLLTLVMIVTSKCLHIQTSNSALFNLNH